MKLSRRCAVNQPGIRPCIDPDLGAAFLQADLKIVGVNVVIVVESKLIVPGMEIHDMFAPLSSPKMKVLPPIVAVAL